MCNMMLRHCLAIAVVALTFKILTGLYLRNSKV